MSLNYPDEPDNVPKGAQLYGPNTRGFIPGWYRYEDGKWYFWDKNKPEDEWTHVDMRRTIGKDIFITKKFPLDKLEPDTQYLYHAQPNCQLRRLGSKISHRHIHHANWHLLHGEVTKEWWLKQIPLADLGWKPRSPSLTPDNDVDNW